MSVELRTCREPTHRRVAISALVTLAVGLAVSCASVDPKPFAEFAESTEQLRAGADAAPGQSTQPVRERAARHIVEASETPDGFREMRTRYNLEVDPPDSLNLNHRNLALVFQLPVFRSGPPASWSGCSVLRPHAAPAADIFWENSKCRPTSVVDQSEMNRSPRPVAFYRPEPPDSA